MADVRDLRAQLGAELEHNPATIDVREQRVRLMNRIYLDVSSAHDWLCLETEVDFPVYAARTGDSTGFTVAVTLGSTLIAFSGSLGASFTSDAGGMRFVGPDGGDYTIVRFTSTTNAIITPAYLGATSAAATDWTIKSDRFYLPVDATKALRFLNPDQIYGPMQIIDRRTRENMTPIIQNTTGTVYWMADDDMMYDRPPDPGWTATGVVGAGTLTGGATYEVCYTFEAEGRESAPSPSVRVTLTSTQNTISVAGMENTVLNSGKYKRLYIRQLTSGPTLPAQEVYGRWLLHSTITTETTTTATITGMPVPTSSTLYYTNGRKYMRTVWAPGQDVKLRLRYLYLPSMLVADSDVPKWPAAFHPLLVYGAAVDLGLSQSTPASKTDRWQKRYDDLYKRFMAAQINVPDAPARRRMRNLTGFLGEPGYFVSGPFNADYGS